MHFKQELTMKTTTMSLKNLFKNPHKNKFNAEKSGGYDSKKEHIRANELKMMLRAGLISNLREQVKYEIIPKQRYEDGKVALPTHYIADFVYTDKNGKTIVEDVKGFRTKEYGIKKKLMLYVHGITIREK